MLMMTAAIVSVGLFKCADRQTEMTVVMAMRHHVVCQHADVGQNDEQGCNCVSVPHRGKDTNNSAIVEILRLRQELQSLHLVR